MRHLKAVILAIALVCSSALGAAAHAQSFPSKPVRIISPYPAGSGPDVAARAVAEKLSGYWGQPVLIEARPGGNGVIALQATKAASPDGYTWVVMDVGIASINPNLFRQWPFSMERDFEAAATLFRTPFFLVTSAKGSVASVADLIAAARARPGEITYGVPYIGSPNHLGAAAFALQTGTSMTSVPYKETGQLFASVSTGEVTWAFGSVATTGPFVQQGRLRLLSVAARQRLPSHPEVPTLQEAGGPANLEVNAWVALFLPKGVPVVVLDRINSDVSRALREIDLRERLMAIGLEPLVLTRAEQSELVRADSRRFDALIRELKLTID